MPDKSEQSLDQLAVMIPADLARQKMGHEEWIEGSINLCVHLAAARGQYKADSAFGEWCAENSFGEEVISKDDRAANIAMGRAPEALRGCLEKTNRNSLLQIYRSEFSRFLHLSKPTKPNLKGAPNTVKRRDNAVSQRTLATEFSQKRGAQGLTCDEFEAEYELLHQAASRTLVDLKANGVLHPTGEKRATRNGGKAEILVHRDFVTDEIRQAKKDKTRGRKPSKSSAPIKRDAVPLYRMSTAPREVTGYPAPEVADQINPETGRTYAQDYVRKYGHAQTMPLDQRVRLDQRKIAARLAPQLRDLRKGMGSFLRTPEPQRDDVVPMDPEEFIEMTLDPEDGAHFRKRVEEELAALEPVLAEVNAYVTALKAVLAAPTDAKIIPIKRSAS